MKMKKNGVGQSPLWEGILVLSKKVFQFHFEKVGQTHPLGSDDKATMDFVFFPNLRKARQAFIRQR